MALHTEERAEASHADASHAAAAHQGAVKRLLVGRAMATGQLEETLLPKWLALPIFASDPLSSVAYATEAALVVLLGASAVSAYVAFPLALGISALLAIVVLSYRQTVLAYETSGGAYIVAKENLGKVPSLVAAAALLTDYILTVAVSVAAGVLALTSAVSSLRGHELGLSLFFVVLIAIANLRGVKEAGILFALPTYAFVTSIFILIGVGLGKCATGGCPQAPVSHPLTAGVSGITLFVVLRAFASGSTALTGSTQRRRSRSSARSRSRCSSASLGSPCTCMRGRTRAAHPQCSPRSRAACSRRRHRLASCSGRCRF
jgi:hypothetical protein